MTGADVVVVVDDVGRVVVDTVVVGCAATRVACNPLSQLILLQMQSSVCCSQLGKLVPVGHQRIARLC